MTALFSLVKTVKNYALDSSVTDEEFLNAFLDPYVSAGRIKGRGGISYYLDAPRTSRLLSGKADVPKALKKALPRYGIVKATARGMSLFVSDYLDEDCCSSLVEDVLSLFSSNGAGGNEIPCDLLGARGDLALFLSISLVRALKECNLASDKFEVWRDGTGSFSIEVGDLFSKGFGRRRNTKNIVVIPVNSGFDTEVSRKLDLADCPVVSETTLHGQWLMRMYKSGESADSISKRIEGNLSGRGVKPIFQEGTRVRYPIGSVAILENERAVFFLLAVSDFDEENNAQSSRDLIKESILSMLDIYDKRGQGLDLYLPLLGTGLSRAGLTSDESCGLVAETIRGKRESIRGGITLVIRPEDAQVIEGMGR